MEKLDQRIQLVASKTFSEDVDAWRRTQPDLPSRSEAIRRLVYSGLTHEQEHPLRMVTAIIRPNRYETIRDALMELGVQGVTVTEVRGFGRQRGRTEFYRGSEYEVLETPKLRLDIVVPVALAEKVVEAVAEAGRTGKVGDGVVFVGPIQNALRIRTGEEDVDAVE